MLVKKVHLVTIVGNPKHLQVNAWSERAGFMLEELNVMVQKDIIKETAGAKTEQIRLRFPHGDRLLPKFLICPSTKVHANLEVGGPAMAFAIMGMISQLPKTIKWIHRQAIIGKIKQTDLRKRPSSLPFMDRIQKASKTQNEKVALMDVIQGLAHAHWNVSQTGAYGFFYRSLQHLGIEAVADYDFDWSNIRGTVVLDGQGNELRIDTRIPPKGRRVAPQFRKRFEDTEEGKRLLADKSTV